MTDHDATYLAALRNEVHHLQDAYRRIDAATPGAVAGEVAYVAYKALSTAYLVDAAHVAAQETREN